MNELPNSWEIVPFLSIADLLRGVTYSKADARSEAFNGSIPVLRANNIQNRQFQLVDLVHVPKKLVADKQLICRGDVVVATSSGSISVVGKAAQAMEDMTAGFGAFCGLLRPKSGINPRYFGFFFSSDDYRKTVSALARGVNINNLKREHFETLAIPLAPLAEQKRIADKLEAVLGRVDACRARLDRVPALLKRFRQSVLAAATSGKLTVEWRMTNGVNDEWDTVNLGRLLTDIRYGTAKKCGYEPIATPVLRIPNIGDGRVTLDDIKYAEFDQKEIRTLALKAGDILVIRSNGSVELVGRVALVSEKEAGFLYAGYLIRLRIDESHALSAYVGISLKSPATRAIIELNARSSSGVNNINTEEIKALPINLPSLPEQQEIVRRVEDLFAFADRIEARLATAQKTVERLTPATLAKAFRGELVPQDPNDEPAATLLERIAKEQSARAFSGSSKHTTGTRRQSKSRSPNVIMKGNQEPQSVVAALESAGTSLSTSQLLHACGVPSDADSRTIESFLIEIRDALASGIIGRDRIEEEDHFQLLKQ